MPDPAPPPRRRWLRRSAIAAGALGTLLLGLELGLRAQGYCTRAAMYYDPDVGFRNRSHQERWMISGVVKMAKMRTNALGFRGPLPPRERVPGRTRVVTLGDSFTFSQGVPEDMTYPAYLRGRLAGESLPVEVMDVSFPGWNLDNELRAYLELARPYRPDAVVLGFTQDDLKPADSGVRWTDTLPFALLGRTALAEAVLRHVMPHLPGYRLVRTPEEQRLRDLYDEDPKHVQRHPDEERARPFWERALATLEDLDDAVREDGGRLIVVVFPSRQQVVALRRARAQGGDEAGAREKLCVLQRTLIERLTARSIPAYDALDAFLDAPDDPLGIVNLFHPSPTGYDALASAVQAALRAEGIVP